MPDVHAGINCVIGFTGDLGEKIIPNVVGNNAILREENAVQYNKICSGWRRCDLTKPSETE